MLKFFSNSLSREVEFDAVASLNSPDLETLHEELKEVVNTLNDVVTGAKSKERASGIPMDPNWMHRVNTKKRIALKFATEVHSRLNGGSTVEQRAEYRRIYDAKFRAMLLEEFGEEELQQIERELVDASKEIYKQWIESTGQRMWFVP